MYNSCSWCSSDTKETLQKKESLKEILEREREKKKKKQETCTSSEFSWEQVSFQLSAKCWGTAVSQGQLETFSEPRSSLRRLWSQTVSSCASCPHLECTGVTVTKNGGALLVYGRNWGLGDTVELCHWSNRMKGAALCNQYTLPQAANEVLSRQVWYGQSFFFFFLVRVTILAAVLWTSWGRCSSWAVIPHRQLLQ